VGGRAGENSPSFLESCKPRNMGVNRDDFVKYSRALYLFGCKGSDHDKPLGDEESEASIAESPLLSSGIIGHYRLR